MRASALHCAPASSIRPPTSPLSWRTLTPTSPLRHPLLRLRRGHPLAQPCPPHDRGPGSSRLTLRLDTTARRIDVPGRKLLITTSDSAEELISYDKLVIGAGAVPVRPPISGLDKLGPGDGVHQLHPMDDTFAAMRTLEQGHPATPVIIGAGYIGLEMAEALNVRGLHVTH